MSTSARKGAPNSIYRILGNGCSIAVDGAEVALNPMIACLSYTPDGGPDTAPQVVDAGALAQRAVGQLNLPKPRVATAPATRAAVGLPTWLWVDRSQWQPLSESISVPRATLRVFAQPTTAIWNMGEGVKTCTNPGRPWQKGLNPAAGCTYQYQRTSKNQPGGAYSTAMRVQYSITWACSGNCSEGGGELGTLDSPATTKQLPVVELVPVLTR